MNRPPVKQLWIQRCIDVYRFHAEQLRNESGWTLEKTAEALNRSTGSVSQDILIAQWLRTHETQIRRFKYMTDALKFVKSKKKESFLAGI
jgi:hypothetical protein